MVTKNWEEGRMRSDLVSMENFFGWRGGVFDENILELVVVTQLCEYTKTTLNCTLYKGELYGM